MLDSATLLGKRPFAVAYFDDWFRPVGGKYNDLIRDVTSEVSFMTLLFTNRGGGGLGQG